MRTVKSAITFSCIQTQIQQNTIDHTCEFYASYQLGMFDQYEALTVANALRRTLLLESNRYTITGAKIENVKHEYSSLPGVRETIFDILINLKRIVLYSDRRFTKTQISFLVEAGPKILRAKHLQLPEFIRCMNPNQYITALESNATFKMIVFIQDSRSSALGSAKTFYSQLVRQKTHSTNTWQDESFFLPIECKVACVRNINYSIHKTDQNKEIIFLQIRTNASIHPSFLLRHCIRKLIVSLLPFYRLKNPLNVSLPKSLNKPVANTKVFYKKLLSLDLCNFPISTCTYRQLQKLKIFTLSDLYELTCDPNQENNLMEEWQYVEVLNLMHKLKHYLNNI